MFGLFGETKKITEKLYEQNLELAVKNKTLSLLENLYQASTLSLMPEDMADKITGIIRKDLNLELAGVLIFNKETDSIAALSFAKSDRCSAILEKLGFKLETVAVKNVSQHPFFKQVLYGQQENATNNIEEAWSGLLSSESLRLLKKDSHVKTMLIYPLVKEGGVLGVLLLGLNRDYNNLNAFEKASVKSCINAIALLLDKAYLYKDLQASYEVEKRAHEIEKKANDELEQLDKVKNQFLSQTQHDLRTPLTSIMGYSDLLLKGDFGKLSKKTNEAVQKIQLLTNGMIKKANNFLDLAQFQLGKSPVELKPGVEIFSILKEIQAELNFKASSRGIYLNLDEPKQEVKISADREKLKAALFNIVDNSVKYTPKGGVSISVITNNQDTNSKQISNFKFQISNSVAIIVRDSGIGIPKDKIETIFETMFERGDQAKKTAGGVGIGLHLSTQILKAHGGKVWAESGGEGKGSTFYIELPYK